MPEASVHRSIHAIGRQRWEACGGGALESFDYLAAVEAAGLKGFAWRYVVVEDRGRPVMVAPAFITDYSLDTTLADFGRKAIAAIRRIAPRAFTLKLGAIGSPCTETVGACFAPDVTVATRPGLLSHALLAFEADARAAGCGLFAIKDTPCVDGDPWPASGRTHRFQSVAGLPTAILDIDFADMDAYMARLSAATRKDMRRKLKAADRLEITVRTEIDDIADRVLELYQLTRARADMQFEELTRAFFTGVMDRMPGRSLCVIYRDMESGDILAANLLLHDSVTLLDKFFCMDGAAGRALNLYFVSWFTNVRLCLERGLRHYQSGQAGYANKLRLGSRLVGASVYFRHRNPLLNQALRLAAPLLSEDQPEAA